MQVLKHISNFTGLKKDLWLTRLSRSDDNNVTIEGFALTKNVLTEFAYSIESAILRKIQYEALRDENTYRFILNFDLSNYPKDI
jgi:hypothetical protein